MSLNTQDAATIKAMILRGDKQHDIAAHFGVNAGRIAEIAMGVKYSEVKAAPQHMAPARKMPRFIDPNAPAARQFEQLMEFIKAPPETSRVLTITPELATLILERLNTGNRRKRSTNIARFAEAMADQLWVLTGDTLKFSKQAVLIDGQNRLSACVRSGAAFRTHVIFGIEDRAFATIDAGAKRTNPDTFQCAGVPYYSVVSPAVRWLMIGDGDRGQSFENREILDYYNKNVNAQQMEWAARKASAVSKTLPRGALAAHLYLFAQKNKRVVERFADDLANRRGVAKTLLNKVESLRKQNGGRIHERQLNALTILAWNAAREERRLNITTLKWTTDEEYPAIV
jgi:hypothetical protein